MSMRPSSGIGQGFGRLDYRRHLRGNDALGQDQNSACSARSTASPTRKLKSVTGTPTRK
jgi:hypothetical protein